ncbi:hypothetical protein Kpol_1066p35 [Vanderwaltozyma polyspora DSM 70294]|uniref:RRM domain-containing protein n=1 Tax=Vanderwaltozyma polyspora (strain ATCC 22028 / DSM 70294 / BCRC 21397 / CBS 2163 / NBRC 10782 / NRRL Y-8283 / UCD 57-17) TaxID=436907 RepID=A7TMQ4_VANPO|nr:uncharacterized protein Kpol_1066p35 [Vanderwaltozyma polyspora DSM 70294]EDO16468.1 hypothetical protein Kpol_1066p35 [Vanderwaltozyma polyspora DSM 70294]
MDKEELELKEELKRLKQEELEKRKRILSITNEKHNKDNITSVFLSNLPNIDNLKQELTINASKFGTIRKDKDGNTLCKIYYDKAGNFEGNALIVYSRAESIPLAIEMMDDSMFHGNQIKVELASFENKKRNYENMNKDKSEEHDVKPLKKLQDVHNKSEQILEVNEQTSDTDDDWVSEKLVIENRKKTAVLSNIVDIYGEQNDEELDEITDDIIEGCQQMGTIEDFKLLKELGKAEIRFSKKEEAHHCISKMNNRFFDGRKIVAYMLDDDQLIDNDNEMHETLKEGEQELANSLQDDLIE